MEKVVIIGGKLQGTEACYLARKAGYRSALIDLRADAPASGVADEVFVCDIRVAPRNAFGPLVRLLRSADLILPALEDADALDAIVQISERYGLPLAFSPEAYSVTSSKLRSDRLIRSMGVPAPARGYASERANAGDFIIQRYIEGPSYSIEAIGEPGNYRCYGITEVHVDEEWDCHLVTTPCGLAPEQEAALRASAMRLAEGVGLRGIMDVEVILHDGEMKTLEIGARIPSQTPAVVLASTGVNMLGELMRLVTGDFGKEDGRNEKVRPPRFASYDNVVVTRDDVIPKGEHTLGAAGPLTLKRGFCGADESMTGFGADGPCGVFINSADTKEALEEKRTRMYESIRAYYGNTA